MSLYGALYSGVSGLTAQSSAMGAISDNITNVSTIGYKNTSVNFQTLVTKQTSSTFYSAGGVQSRPRQAVDVQGLLQASTSQTDLSISGGGFFVVNEASQPTGSDAYFYTRAGSFKQNSEGYLANSGGYFLQGWPTDASGEIVHAKDANLQTNLNVISNDYMETVNLSRVAGSAAATTGITVGANLPTTSVSGDQFNTDVQFFDTLGAARSMSIGYTKSGIDNQWATSVIPPAGTSVVTSFDGSSNVYDSYGRLDFKTMPADGSIISIEGITYEFDTDGAYGGTAAGSVAQSEAWTLAGASDNLDEFKLELSIGGVNTIVTSGVLGAAVSAIDIATALVSAINSNAYLGPRVTASNIAGTSAVLTLTSDVAGLPFTLVGGDFEATSTDTGGATTLAGPTAVTANVTPTTVRVDINGAATVGATTQALVNAVNGYDSDFTATNDRIALHPDDSTIVLFHDDGTGDIIVNPSGLLNASGSAATDQTASFTAQKIHSSYTAHGQFTFASNPTTGQTIIVNGKTYEFGGVGANINVAIGSTLDATLATLKTAIETNDPYYSPGSVVLRESDNNSVTFKGNNTLVLPSIPAGVTATFDDGTYNSITSLGALSTGTGTWDNTTDGGMVFDSKGLPLRLNMQKLQILGLTNGAANMDDGNSPMISLDFGTVGETEGMTQFGDEFDPGVIDANGSRFGTFSGVSIAPDGLMMALFDNGDIRPIFRIPISTFVNPNGLNGRTGNVWNASEASGNYTLRTAGNGAAGVITQSSLEASTVDIGSEFTQMIVVQRAYSASTKIISTADQMLEELMRTKR